MTTHVRLAHAGTDPRKKVTHVGGNRANPLAVGVIRDFLGQIGEEPVGVMLFETNGNLSSLEAYSCSGQLAKFDFPKISTLHPY